MRHSLVAALASAAAFTLAPSAARAWTPTTHVYLAQKAWEDAQDGKVTINFVDHDGRTIGAVAGEYNVSPEILDAIRRNPHAFYAGVLGPDAYPDIATGQMRIHPPGGSYSGPDSNPGGPGTDAWLRKLWVASHTAPDNTQPNLAFTVGYLSHAAGDMFAHTFMNTFSGGIFDLLGLNGLRHITLEGYIGMRTPPLNPITYPFGFNFPAANVQFPPGMPLPIHDAVDRFGIENGVKEFILKHLVDAQQVTGGEKNRSFSIPAIFTDLRQQLRQSTAAYEAQEAPLRQRFFYTHRLALWSGINHGMVAARACGNAQTACPDPTVSAAQCPPEYPTGDPGWCASMPFGGSIGFAVAMSVVAAAASLEWTTWKTLPPRELEYLRQKSQIYEIDKGLGRWIDTSHDAAQAWFFNPEGLPDINVFLDEYLTWATTSLPYMVTGLPSWPGDTFGAVINFIPSLVRPQIQKMRDSVVDFICKSAFGADANTLKERYTRPQVWLNQLYAQSTPPMSILRANQIMKLSTQDASDIGNTQVVKQTYKVDSNDVFPAAYNAMVMIKLLMMAPADVEALLRKLGDQTTTLPPLSPTMNGNPMLGFAKTIDGSNQWMNGMVFAKECAVYRKIFMNQRPPKTGAETSDPVPNLQAAIEPADTMAACAAAAPPPQYTVLLPGAQARPQKLGRPVEPPPAAPAMALVTLPVFIQTAFPAPAALSIAAGDGKALAAGEIPTHPPDTLFPSQSVMLTLAPSDTPHRWSIANGPGRLVDPPDPATGASPQAQAAKLAEIDKRSAQAVAAEAACKGDMRCLKKPRADLRSVKRERRDASAAMKFVNATPLAGPTVLYEAPAVISAPVTVMIKVDATDGSNRSATILLTLLPQPPALNVKAPATVKPGGSFALVNDPPIPVKWTIVSGPKGGTIGDPNSTVRAQLVQRDVTPLTTALRQRDAKLTGLPPEETPQAAPATGADGRMKPMVPPGPRVVDPRLDRGQVLQEKSTLVRDRYKDLVAAEKKIQEIDGTYRAPANVTTPQDVVLKGVALDGTGRSATITVRVTP